MTRNTTCWNGFPCFHILNIDAVCSFIFMWTMSVSSNASQKNIPSALFVWTKNLLVLETFVVYCGHINSHVDETWKLWNMDRLHVVHNWVFVSCGKKLRRLLVDNWWNRGGREWTVRKELLELLLEMKWDDMRKNTNTSRMSYRTHFWFLKRASVRLKWKKMRVEKSFSGREVVQRNAQGCGCSKRTSNVTHGLQS